MSMKRKGDERDTSMKRKGEQRDMFMKRKEAKKGPSSSSDAVEESDEPKIDIKSILKDIEFLGKISFLISTLLYFDSHWSLCMHSFSRFCFGWNFCSWELLESLNLNF